MPEITAFEEILLLSVNSKAKIAPVIVQWPGLMVEISNDDDLHMPQVRQNPSFAGERSG